MVPLFECVLRYLKVKNDYWSDVKTTIDKIVLPGLRCCNILLTKLDFPDPDSAKQIINKNNI
jgi:hypothetical protein